MVFALMAFAFMGSSSSNSSSGSPRTVIGKRPRASLVSALRQNRILALFATHVLQAGVALTPPLSASDRSGDSAAQNKCPLWARNGHYARAVLGRTTTAGRLSATFS